MAELPEPAEDSAEVAASAAPSASTAVGSAAAGMTAEELAEARRRSRQRLQVDLAERAVDVAVLAALAFPAAQPLAEALAAHIGHRLLLVAAMYVVVAATVTVVSLPLMFYGGYVLERRYGLLRQSLARWCWRALKRGGLSLAFGTLLIVGLYALFWTCGRWWWLAAAAGMLLLSVVLGQLLPVLLIPLFYKVERLEADSTEGRELRARMARLVEGTGLSVEGIYRLELSAETAKANAMLTGLGRTRRVLLGDTLLSAFTPDEIEVVLAHEVGHHVYRHLPKLIAAQVTAALVAMGLVDQMLAWHIGSGYDPRQMPVAALPLVLLLLTLCGLAGEPLLGALSRRFERQCDRYALARTGRRAAYQSAFAKLARINKEDPAPHPLAVRLLHSHPPIAERLAMAEPAANGPAAADGV